MGERKVLNFYVPPDFDASIIPRQKRDRNRTCEVRTMLPFSMRCSTCGEYLYRGKKFTARKETVLGEEYMGIRKFRFYIKCSVCSASIVFKTDPKNSDYEMESGGSRNFEVWRDDAEVVDALDKEREEEDKVDAMKALENRTVDNKQEMDVLDALDEIKAINQRHERIDTEALIGALSSSSSSGSAVLLPSGLTAADEELVKSIKFRNQGGQRGGILKALPDSDDEEADLKVPGGANAGATGPGGGGLAAQVLDAVVKSAAAAAGESVVAPPPAMLIKKRVKRTDDGGANVMDGVKKQKTASAPPAAPVASAPSSLGSLLAYGSDDD